ncbi:MAG: hypothetical protein HY738_01405, partial [Bacteroidia bacterium]|nr:hypothetical protein [Bacteroidia bacterium]
KDYTQLQPVITLIWMVDDTLNFTEDYVGYNMSPEIISDFLNNDKLWLEKDIQKLIAQRKFAVKQLNNNTKNLGFLQKNRLIWAFQKNIVKNEKFSKYRPWFELAEKTRNKMNKKTDFLQFEQDKIFVEIMRRICKDVLTEEDVKYIKNYDKFWDGVRRYEQGIKNESYNEIYNEIVIKLINKGYSNEIIKDGTDLTDEEINNLRSELK